MKRLVFLCLLSVVLVGCRGYRSEKPPLHPNINMDYQAKFKAQTLPLDPPSGTVPYRVGQNRSFMDETSPPVTKALILRGQDRYDIYCAVCHDRTGAGKGMVVKRGFLPPPDLSEARLRNETDQYLYNVIKNGIRNMPSYAKQLSPKDRWAVVYYVRALQKANHGTLRDVPAERRGELK